MFGKMSVHFLKMTGHFCRGGLGEWENSFIPYKPDRFCGPSPLRVDLAPGLPAWWGGWRSCLNTKSDSHLAGGCRLGKVNLGGEGKEEY